jgi:hypothetical protein
MDSSHFDRLVRSFGASASRRTALRGLVAGVLGATGIGATLSELDARRRRRRGNRNRRRCGKQYDGCNRESDCCDGLICKQLTNPNAEAKFDGTCAYKRGCGKKNDYCGKNRDCCRQFQCRGKRCKRRNN